MCLLKKVTGFTHGFGVKNGKQKPLNRGNNSTGITASGQRRQVSGNTDGVGFSGGSVRRGGYTLASRVIRFQ